MLNLILDSDVLVLALHKPRYEYLIENHHKAVNLFKSCIESTNSLYLPTTVAIWSLWYLSWKSGVKSYWISGLSENHQEKICNGEVIAYP